MFLNTLIHFHFESVCKTTDPFGQKLRSMAKSGTACMFPFKYFGKEYHTCTLDYADSVTGGKPWCVTKVDKKGKWDRSKTTVTLEGTNETYKHSNWGICDEHTKMMTFTSDFS